MEIPPRFADLPPVHPGERNELSTWSRAQGLATDVKAYGAWMRDEAERSIGHLYPDATGPDGEKLTPIAWIWARTVKSPDPVWNGHVPLVSSWVLRKKSGKPKVWVEPVIDRGNHSISFQVREGGEPTFGRTVKRGTGTCIATGATIPVEYIRAEGRAGRMGAHLLAVVAEGNRRRIYLSSCSNIPDFEPVENPPSVVLSKNTRHSMPPSYGLTSTSDLFTPRQLIALTTFCRLLKEVKIRVIHDATTAEMSDDSASLQNGGRGIEAYAEAVATYLAFVVDKCAGYWSATCPWDKNGETMGHTFSRQAFSMTWDFAEANPFSKSTGNWMSMLQRASKAIESLPASGLGKVRQMDAREILQKNYNVVISTDPPYYDNVPYSDISDFFYVWLRHMIRDIWPDECATLLTPKTEELVADPLRHGSKQAAQRHFEQGIGEVMAGIDIVQHPAFPATIYYAYKATESKERGSTRSTGWDTFLQAVVDAGLQVTATWPLRTERGARLRSVGSNALASSIVLTCRSRSRYALAVSRGEFVSALRRELPQAIKIMQSGKIAPVDLPQSTIGPGIMVFSRYAKVVEANGSKMPVRDALAIINEVLDDVLYGEESELGVETRFALAWYAQYGFDPGPFGDADSIAHAKNTAIDGVVKAGVGESSGGKFRLYNRSELDLDWDPQKDSRLTAWESLQHLAASLEQSESQAARLLARLGSVGDHARQLAYLLYKIANDNDWSEEADTYNGLVAAWSRLQEIAPRMLEQELKDLQVS